MKISIKTAEFAKALYRVQGIADKKSSKPILSHVLLVATAPNELALTATDLHVELAGRYACVVEKPGSVVLHAHNLYDIVKALPTESVEMTRHDNHWVELHAGTSRFRLVGLPGEEFPSIGTQRAQEQCFSMPSDQLVQMIDRTLFCVSTDDNRYNLSGVYCENLDNHKFRMVATDGHRLALAETTFDNQARLERPVIVPRKGFQELRRVLVDLPTPSEPVQMAFSANTGIIKVGSVVLSTRFIDGNFPDYHQVIPKSSDKTARVARVALAEALRRVSLLSQDRAHGIRLEFQPGMLQLRAEDPEYGDAHESLAIEYQAEPVVIGFNARYLLDVLALIPEQGVIVELTDQLSPVIVRPLEESGFIAVVMPMRI